MDDRTAPSSGSIRDRLPDWEREERRQALERAPEPADGFQTASGIDVKPVYTSADVGSAEELPGRYPFTRGLHATMYRGRPWTRRQVVGLGTAREANERHRYVMAQGQTGLSNDFDLPTITGHDSDHPMAKGEVGRNGVAIDTIEDMRDLMYDIPLDEASTSMTINHPAAILLPMYLAVADDQGVPWSVLRGTVQNDPLKEFFAQKTFAFPPAPSVRVAIDVMEFCARNVPQWNPISLCGYQTRDSGATADQEVGLTFAAAITYIDELLERGLEIDDFAPRISFLMYIHMDLLEEVAKFRAARRLWARLMRERYGAKLDQSCWFRVHVQTGAALLTRQQPENNIARGALQCLAGALGGVQSMALSTFDEAYSIPTERAQRIALRTQQIVALETGVTATPDPLAGSYYVESLTDELERRAEEWMQKVEQKGGMLAAVESGWVEGMLNTQAYEVQRQIERGQQTVVGVNDFLEGNEDDPPEVFRVDRASERAQVERLERVRDARDQARWSEALSALRETAQTSENLVPVILAAVEARASEGEIVGALNDSWGTYDPPSLI